MKNLSRREKKKLEQLKKVKRRKKILRNSIVLIIIAFAIYIKFYYKKEPTKNMANEEKIAETISTNIVTENNVETNEVTEENSTDEVVYVIEDIDEVEYTIAYATEDEEVKAIVQEYMTSRNLTEENFAFFYYKPETQNFYFYNENKFFTAASTMKVPIAMIYYDKINNGELTLDKTLQYKSNNYEAGGGTTNSLYKVGDYIPISFLLEQMIVNSDNTAWKILMSGLGGNSASRKLAMQYANREIPSNFTSENIISAGYGYDIIKNIYENQEKYEELISYMKRSSGGGYLKKDISDYEIAHKYGSYDGNIHDYGIVYCEEPYIIGIFTSKVANAEDLIAEMNKSILEIQNK